MKKNKKAIGIILTVIMLISVFVAIAPAVSATEAGDLEEIQKAIEGSGAEWQAGYTSVSGLSLEEKQRLCGLKIRESVTMEKMIVSTSSVKRSRYDENAIENSSSKVKRSRYDENAIENSSSKVKRSRYDENATNEMGIASIDTTMEVPKTSSLAGYNIAVVNAGGYPLNLRDQLVAWGATVDLINVPAITASLLSSYDLVWIPCCGAAGAVDAGGKAAAILSYVQEGGGEILTQPNEVMTPQCLPYTWQITDSWYGDACATAILDPTHELTAGLTEDDMPDAFDRSGTVDPAYTLLALSGESEPTFGCANYGDGRVIVEMDAPLGPGICDVCGDCPSLSEAMVTRMVEWVSSPDCDAFDWRDYLGGDWTTTIKDQGACGSCWAFGSLAAMEAHIDLQEGDPTFNRDLSEQQLLSCSPGDCDGWYEDAVLNWLRDEGTVDEACFPYQADDTIPCSDHCPDWESRTWKITDWGWVATTIPAITGHLHDAPLVTGMAVYEDFSFYDGGIYEHVWGDLRGYHLVSMVGYNQCEDYWICKNSWGTDWGEEGWFRIRYGECDIENMNAYIEPPIIEPLPDDGWDVRLDATCDVGTDVAEFGLNADATDGFDPEFDEVEPPPSPGDYQQAYFYYPGNPDWCRKLSTSYIPPHFMDAAEWNSWPFQLAYSADPSDVTITWNADDIDAVPPDYGLYFVVDGEQIDMRTTPSYTFSATTGTYEFEILAITATPYTFELYTGWNMISFPVDPLDKDPDNIFGPGYYQLVTWDAVSGSYVAVDEVETGIGYWLLVTEDRSVTVMGVPTSEYYTGLIQGWNMIGSIFVDTNVPGGTETVPPNQMHPSLYTWNVDHYDTTQDIDPGLGYWALAYDDCELHVFPAPPPPPSAPSIQADENNWGVKLDATCDVVGTDVAEFGLNAAATDGFDPEFDVPEPPPPPCDHQQAYFYYPGNPDWCRKLSTSYIPPHFMDAAEWNSWPFQLAYSADPSDVTITWNADDIDAVPPDYGLYFVVDGEQIDMRTTPLYTFSATTGTYEFEILAITEEKKPDLVISEKSETIVIVGDELFNITYTVANIGCADAGPTNTTIQIDTETPIEVLTPAIAKGDSYTKTVGPYNCPCGETLTISVCADNDNEIVEKNETNNCLVNELECPGKPDLVISEKSETIVGDELFNITYTVANIGCADAGPTNTTIQIDTETPIEVLTPAIAKGDSYTKTVGPYNCPCGETLTISVCADNDNEIVEKNETNNCLVNELECPGKPDLVISEKSETIVGDELFNITYTVANIGCADAGPTNTTIQIDTETPIEVLTPAIAKGDSYTKTVGPYNCPCGETLTISVCADNDNEIVEKNETNNCLVNELECPGKPDLVISEKSETIVGDELFNITYTVANIGCADAGPTNTTIQIDTETPIEVLTPAIAKGDSYTKTVGPYNCPCGETLTISVCADNDNEIVEKNETNNCLVNELECPGKPDLVISEKSETIVGDELFNITYTVANIGCADAGPTNTTIQIDTETPIEVLTPAIAKGDSYTKTVGPYNCPCGETLTISVCADNDNEIVEKNETNNCLVNELECPDKPDLTVTEITVNYDASSLGGRAIGPEPGPDVHTECNNLSAVIEEENVVDVLASFDVSFEVDGTTLSTVRVPGLTGGANKTVYCNCSWYPYAGDVFAIDVTVDSNHEIPESNETNNTKWNNGTAVSNGYKGDGWQGPDMNLINEQCHDQDTINLTYSVGDSEYVSGSTQWTEYTSSWTTTDLPVPDGAEIEKAMLYVYYTWDKNNVMPDNVNMVFNGNNIALARDYSDRKGFGDYDFPSGMLIYDVRSHFAATGTNNAILTKAVAADVVSMRGMLLMVVYKHPDEPERIICIDEGYDMLYAKDSYAVTSEEATTYAPFTCCEQIPVDELGKATLIAVAPSASDGDDMNRLSFNDGLWNGIWDHYEAATQLGIAEANVLAYLKPAENRANFQSHIPAGGDKGDFMDASNAFLILEKNGEIPCPAKYAVYQANVRDPEGRLNDLRALRDNKLEDGYVTRYYEYSPALTMVLSRADSDLVKEGAQLVSKYSIPVGLHVQGMDVNERITRQDVVEALSFTDRLKSEVMKNRDAIGVKSTEAILVFIDEFEGQVKASEGKTFSAALKSSIYYEDERSRVYQEIEKE